MAHMVSDKLMPRHVAPGCNRHHQNPKLKRFASCHGQWPPDDEKTGTLGKCFPASNCRVLKGPGVFKGRGCSWGTLRIPFGKIGEP